MKTGIGPRLAVFEGRPGHEIGKVRDECPVFRQRNEIDRGNRAAVRMRPARQGFRPDDASILQRDLGLVGDAKLAFLKTFLQVFLPQRRTDSRNRRKNSPQFGGTQRFANGVEQLKPEGGTDAQCGIEDTLLQAADQEDRGLELLTAEILKNFDPVAEAFKVYDPEGTGFIDTSVLKAIFENLGFGEISEDDLAVLTETGDVDGDGRISLMDFRKMLDFNKEEPAAAPAPAPAEEKEE